MTRSWRPLAVAAAVNLTVGAGVAAGQVVIVRNAPPQSNVELVLNAAAVGSATADAAGTAMLSVDPSANVKTEMDAHIYVDVCDKLRRVLIVERNMQLPPTAAGCDRREIVGLFLVRRISTLVVDVGGANPTLLLRQGRVSLGPPRAWSSSQTGIVVFGGGGLVKVHDVVAVSCGNAPRCTGKNSKGAYTAGADIWLTRFLAAEVGYLRTAKVTANGSGDGYRFESFLRAHVLTIAGKGGLPIGPVRLYGHLGTNYSRASFQTTQTIDDVTVTIGDVTQTTKGGTQTFDLKTTGWGWLFGGGAEAWVAPSVAIFGEVGRARLRGSAPDDQQGEIDDRLTLLLFGARVRIGR